MTPIRIPSQVFCPHCQAANLPRSPYCSGCGAPLGDLALAEVPRNRFSSVGLSSSPVVRLETLLTDRQDAASARLAYDTALAILTEGEELRYIATGSKSILGPASECVVATSKRMMIFRKKRLGKSEMDDIFWRDVTRAEMKDLRGAVSLCLDSVQGWRLTTEALPAVQARKLYEVVVANTPRLQQVAAQAVQVSASPALPVQAPASQAASTPVLVSQPAAVPAQATAAVALPTNQAQPLQPQVPEQPGAPASIGTTLPPDAVEAPATMPAAAAFDQQPAMTAAQVAPVPAVEVASSQEAVPEQAQPAENEHPSKPLIPTPESVLQEILRSLPARNPSSRPLTGPAAHNSEPLVHAPLVPAQVPEPAVSVQATQQPVSQAPAVRVPQPAVQPAVNMAAAPAPAAERQVTRESGPLAGAAGLSPRKAESGPLPPTRQGASGPLTFPAKPSTGPVPGPAQGAPAQPHARVAPTGPL